ncbi:MAG: hypothetical protein KatS3mg110_0483 [Pirellulaceae bacterium]|nr:MAG: hypothetical protein KatS3mg110_0473 [Pirellulaceae bacterium]GIW92442.1 MAG: hypothetical protein KatS3mg110_0483 [Pirellulaceae bacterium]
MGSDGFGVQLLLQEVNRAEELAAKVENYVQVLDPQRRKLSELLAEVQAFKRVLGQLRARGRQGPKIAIVPYSEAEREIATQLIEDIKNSWLGDGRKSETADSELPVGDYTFPRVSVVTPLIESALEGDSLAQVVSSPVRLLLLEYGRQRDGTVLDFLRKVGGAAVVVLLLSQRYSKDKVAAEVRQAWENRGIQADNATLVIQPMFLEGNKLKRDHDALESVACLVHNLRESIALGNHVVNVQPFVQNFLAKCRPLVSPILQTVAPDLARLQAMEKSLPEILLKKMIPSGQHLAVDVRNRLRLKLLENTPVWCFPYRTLLGTLLLTAGAWDRLLLLPVSKVFGALKLGFRSAANLETLREMAERFQKSVIEQCHWEARKELQPVVKEIHRKLWKLMSSEEETIFHADFSDDVIQVRGLDTVWEAVKATVDQTIAQISSGHRGVLGTGALATVLFATLMAGPLYAAYDAYLTAWWEAIFHGNEQSWADFDLVGFSTFVVAFFYSTVPVFVMALVAMSLVARNKAVQGATIKILDQCNKTLKEAQDGSIVRVEVRDQKLDAVIGLHRIMTEGDTLVP